MRTSALLTAEDFERVADLLGSCELVRGANRGHDAPVRHRQRRTRVITIRAAGAAKPVRHRQRRATTSARLRITGRVCGRFGAGITTATVHGFWSVTM